MMLLAALCGRHFRDQLVVLSGRPLLYVLRVTLCQDRRHFRVRSHPKLWCEIEQRSPRKTRSLSALFSSILPGQVCLPSNFVRREHQR